MQFDGTNNPAYFNRYAYTFNDPINNIDPDGMQVDAGGMPPLIYPPSKDGSPDAAELAQLHMKGQLWTAEGVAAVYGGGSLKAGRAAPGLIGGFLLRRGASKSFGGAVKLISRTTQGLAKTSGKSGRTTFQSFGSGGQKGAEKLFNTLTRGSKPTTTKSGGQLGRLKDGSRVQMSTRNGVTSVRVTQKTATTGSRIKKTTTYKVRFKEKQ